MNGGRVKLYFLTFKVVCLICRILFSLKKVSNLVYSNTVVVSCEFRNFYSLIIGYLVNSRVAILISVHRPSTLIKCFREGGVKWMSTINEELYLSQSFFW